MEFELFEEFAMIAKYGSLSEAARELHTTQPALSKHLAAIEKEVGAELFNRDTSPMELTYVGEVFLEGALSTNQKYLQMMDRVRAAKGSQHDLIRISGLLESQIGISVLDSINLFSKQYPNTKIKVCSNLRQTPFDSIREGTLDIAIEPYSEMIDTHNLNSFTLSLEEPFLVVEKSHRLANKKSISIRDLSNETFVSMSNNKDHALRKHIQDISRRYEFPGKIPGELQIIASQSRLEILIMGINDWVMMLPASMPELHSSLFNEKYIAIPIEERDCWYDIRAFWNVNASDKVLQFVESLGSNIKNNDAPDK